MQAWGRSGMAEMWIDSFRQFGRDRNGRREGESAWRIETVTGCYWLYWGGTRWIQCHCLILLWSLVTTGIPVPWPLVAPTSGYQKPEYTHLRGSFASYFHFLRVLSAVREAIQSIAPPCGISNGSHSDHRPYCRVVTRRLLPKRPVQWERWVGGKNYHIGIENHLYSWKFLNRFQ